MGRFFGRNLFISYESEASLGEQGAHVFDSGQT